jgi:hypothetical protein
MATTTQSVAPAAVTCDICHQQIASGERSVDDGSEIAHTACVGQWFRSNFGRESLS